MRVPRSKVRLVAFLAGSIFLASVSDFAYASVKAMLEYRRDLRASKNYTVNTILRFAF
jgi:hypothetical protein